jgi:hypothetical protein
VTKTKTARKMPATKKPAKKAAKSRVGRKPKDDADKYIKVSVSMPKEMYDLGRKLGSVSHFVQQLYYGAM